MKALFSPLTGKYRALVLAIGVFLLIDSGVWVLNIYAARQIESDARLINTAGLLRTYSQQLTKGLLTLELDLRNGNLTQSSLAEISEAMLGFQEARRVLDAALAAEASLDTPPPASLRQEAREKLRQIQRTWTPIDREVGPLVLNGDPQPEAAQGALQVALPRNNKLMRQADDLALALEEMAGRVATHLRWIQACALVLALINFAIIVTAFVGRLIASDRHAARLRQETGQLLDAVDDGLFLLRPDLTVGGPRSAALVRLLGPTSLCAPHLRDILEPVAKPEIIDLAEDYVRRLFNPNLDPPTQGPSNPLTALARPVSTPNRQAATHLSFEFQPIREDRQVVAVLVSVVDVSWKIRLEQELARQMARADDEQAQFTAFLDHNPLEVAAFLHQSSTALKLFQQAFAAPGPSQIASGALISQLRRLLQGLVTDAARLGCDGIRREAARLEEGLHGLRDFEIVSADDMAALQTGFARLIEMIKRIETVVQRILRLAKGKELPHAACQDAG